MPSVGWTEAFTENILTYFVCLLAIQWEFGLLYLHKSNGLYLQSSGKSDTLNFKKLIIFTFKKHEAFFAKMTDPSIAVQYWYAFKAKKHLYFA